MSSSIASSMTALPSSTTDSAAAAAAASSSAAAIAYLDSLPDAVIGPPNWSQLVYVASGYPYYRPNSILLAAALWLLISILISIRAFLVLRRAKRKNNADPIVRDILTWTRFGPAMLCTMITYMYAIVDDGVRAGMAYVQQRYFIVQFLFTAFDYGAQIFLLFTVYTLLFRLMHRAPLGSGWLSRVHVANYMIVRIVFCAVLGLLAIVVEGVSLAFLAQSVFITTSDLAGGVGNAAFNINLVYGFLYLVAALEVLIVSGHMVRMQKKFRAGNKRDVIANLVVVAIPLFLAAVIRVFGTFVGIPPLPAYSNTTYTSTPRNALVVTCAIVVPLASLLAQYGVVDVAVKADASLNQVSGRFDQGERLDSIDVVLMDRDPTMAHEAPCGLDAR